MVKEYLEKIKQELIEKRVILNEKISSCEKNLKENEKFIQILEDTNDPNYEAFTPRETNTFNRRKIKELREEQKTIFENVTNLTSHSITVRQLICLSTPQSRRMPMAV